MRISGNRLSRVVLTVGLAAVAATNGACSDDDTTPSAEGPGAVKATGQSTATATEAPKEASRPADPTTLQAERAVSGGPDPGRGPDHPIVTVEAATPPVPESFETCSGFLELQDVQKIAGRTDVSLVPLNVNSGPQEPNESGIEILCVIEYITPARPAGRAG